MSSDTLDSYMFPAVTETTEYRKSMFAPIRTNEDSALANLAGPGNVESWNTTTTPPKCGQSFVQIPDEFKTIGPF